MQTMCKPISTIHASVMLAFVAVFLATASNSVAKENPAEEVTVAAHVPLADIKVSKMFLQQENGREYLYIQQASEQGFTVVDVTKPNKPIVGKRSALPNTAAKGKLQVFRDGFAITEIPEPQSSEAPAQEVPPAQMQPTGVERLHSVRVLDLSDPENPRTIKTFEGVSSIISDDGRNLIYLTNSEGLWILRHRRRSPHQICDSESGFLPLANCYAY